MVASLFSFKPIKTVNTQHLKNFTDRLSQLQRKIVEKQKDLEFLQEFNSGERELLNSMHYVRFVFKHGNGNALKEINATREEVQLFATIMTSRLLKEIKELQNEISEVAESISML